MSARATGDAAGEGMGDDAAREAAWLAALAAAEAWAAERCAALGDSLYAMAKACLAEADPARKVALSLACGARIARDDFRLPADAPPAPPVGEPGRPARPRLVEPRHLPQRGLGRLEGRAAFVHAVAHIEFNAINLAWDAAWRFRGLPRAYHADWASVAWDEARHFALLQRRLARMGQAYGDFDAHDGLWTMCRRTEHDALARMALVPRVLEARGLDVTPGMIRRLALVGDAATVAALETILAEEVRHVAVGTRWFQHLCAGRGLPPRETFLALVREHCAHLVRGPFNTAARIEAGFDAAELAALEAMAPPPPGEAAA